MVYLPTWKPLKTSIHVGKYTIVPWMVWVMIPVKRIQITTGQPTMGINGYFWDHWKMLPHLKMRDFLFSWLVQQDEWIRYDLDMGLNIYIYIEYIYNIYVWHVQMYKLKRRSGLYLQNWSVLQWLSKPVLNRYHPFGPTKPALLIFTVGVIRYDSMHSSYEGRLGDKKISFVNNPNLSPHLSWSTLKAYKDSELVVTMIVSLETQHKWN